MTTQFDQIWHKNELGKFRVAASGMAWKGAETGETVHMAGQSAASKGTPAIDWVQWTRVARQYQLRVGLKDGKDHRMENFEGFMREDFDKLSLIIKNSFGKTLETKDVTFKGWNWGTTDFQGKNLVFMVSDRTAFELPLDQVTNSNLAGKTEVSLEFASAMSSSKAPAKNAGDEMVEIRFHVPGNLTKPKGAGASDAGSDVEVDDDEEEVSAAQVFHDQIKETADIVQDRSDLILSFEEILVVTPRGRYDMDMYPEFFRLRGKTYDYKIFYSGISRLFLLPKDDQHVMFILDLKQVINQGQTRYQYLVMQFAREEEITAELNMTEEEVAKYDKLKKNYEDPTFEVVSGIFRGLARKKIVGVGSFQSRNSQPGVKANLKAVQGDLFFLEKYIFFVSKQPTLIEVADIHQVVFSRVGASMGVAASRTFDLKIVTKSGPEHNFTSLNKEDYEPVESYLKDKKIKIKNEMMEDAELLAAAVGDDDDEDMASVVSSDDEGPSRTKASRGGLDDDDSEEDEDFQASESDEGSPSSSSGSDDDAAATASDASGDIAMVKDKKGKGKAKEGDGAKKVAKKKKAALKPEGSDAEDDNEDKPKKKAAPKPKPKKKSDNEMEVDGDEAPKKKKVIKPKDPSKPKPKPKSGDAMDVDEDKPKPKPKPKPKATAKPSEDSPEPPKKKAKTSAD